MMEKIESDRRRARRRRDVTADPRRSCPAGGFGARDVVPLAGMGSYDTLDYWATRGILKPSLAAASGTGSQRRYSFADVVAARMAISLRAQGLGFQSVGRIVSRISALGDSPARPLEGAWLVLSGRQIFVTYDRQDLPNLMRYSERGLLWFVVRLEPIVRQVRHAIARTAGDRVHRPTRLRVRAATATRRGVPTPRAGAVDDAVIAGGEPVIRISGIDD
jgi:DNA-binding transcriptional MerR regulator